MWKRRKDWNVFAVISMFGFCYVFKIYGIMKNVWEVILLFFKIFLLQTVSPDAFLCLEHIWTEPAALARNNGGSKVV